MTDEFDDEPTIVNHCWEDTGEIKLPPPERRDLLRFHTFDDGTFQVRGCTHEPAVILVTGRDRPTVEAQFTLDRYVAAELWGRIERAVSAAPSEEALLVYDCGDPPVLVHAHFAGPTRVEVHRMSDDALVIELESSRADRIAFSANLRQIHQLQAALGSALHRERLALKALRISANVITQIGPS
jgi:hypothetical protein